MRAKILTILALVGPVPVPMAMAQAVRPADSARSETIERLLAVTGVERKYSEAADAALANRMTSMPSLSAYGDIIKAFSEKYGNYAAIKADLIRLYRETFSEKEVEELIRFYESDFGSRTLSKLWQLNVRQAQLASDRIQAHLPELTDAILARNKTVPPQS